MIRMLPPVRKHNRSSGLRHALALDATYITSPVSGSIWMEGSVPRKHRCCLVGRHRKDGVKACVQAILLKKYELRHRRGRPPILADQMAFRVLSVNWFRKSSVCR